MSFIKLWITFKNDKILYLYSHPDENQDLVKLFKESCLCYSQSMFHWDELTN